MFVLTLSTPERASVYIANRTHKSIVKSYAASYDGYSLWYYNGKYRYIGVIISGKLIKP